MKAKTRRGTVRRSVAGIRANPERAEERLAEKFDVSYRAWCQRRGLPAWDCAPNMRRSE